ncbi:plasmid pRiA4b ORF-3 family protein [Mesorhizobium sp. B2-6-5]|uniref:plasmid pRiA4b ORF-3 family protein n=1 Tax=Mesorhizobium sp. B2-6-5 TaxID=2589912 RepID=UPI001FEDF135|nr:plasmid pRiA4b ORF-3 family protein [Mesorhizobium sp. B2-6-5]
MQFRIWLKDVSPMLWPRLQVASTMTLREFHGVLQVVMEWEGTHLYQFVIHTVRYGSWETGARSPDIALGELKLRKGGRFLYEYDLNIPWEHEIRLEERQPFKPGAHYRGGNPYSISLFPVPGRRTQTDVLQASGFPLRPFWKTRKVSAAHNSSCSRDKPPLNLSA